MADTLSWSLDFNLNGNGLQQAAAQLRELQGQLQSGQKAVASFEADGRKISLALENGANNAKKGFLGVVATLGDVITVAKGAFAALSAPLKALDQFGDTALKAFGERASSLRAYTTLLGDAKQAQIAYSQAQAFALKTELTVEETQKAQQRLFVAGFRGDKANSLLAASADLASITPGGPEEKRKAMEGFARSVGQIKNKGKLEQEELNQLAESSNLGAGVVKEELRKLLNLKTIDEVNKKQKDGAIDANTAIAAIERAVLKQLGTSKLGEYAVGAAGTVAGLTSNRNEAMKVLLQSFDAEENIPSVKRYKEALTSLNDTLSAGSPAGQNLGLVLQDLANTSIGLKAAVTSFSDAFLVSFGESYRSALDNLGVGQKGLDDLGISSARLGKALGGVGSTVANLIHLMEWVSPVVDVFAEAIGYVGGVIKQALLLVGYAIHSIGQLIQNPGDWRNIGARLGNQVTEFGMAAMGMEKPFSMEDDVAKQEADSKKKTEGGIPYSIAKPDPRSVANESPVAAAKAKGKGGGKGGGGGDGGGVTLSFDGGGELAALRLPMPGDAALPGEVALPAPPPVERTAEKLEKAAEQLAAREEKQPIEVVINIYPKDSQSAREIAQEAGAEVTRILGRLARTPSPVRTAG